MAALRTREAVLAAATLLALAGCNEGGGLPSNATRAVSNQAARSASPADTTSILKLLTKNVEISSTIDPTNGDTGPRAISQVTFNYGELKRGDLLVCNFADSSGTAGNGTTIELIAGVSGSSPSTFYQGSDIEGCDGDALTSGDQVYATGLTSKLLVWIDQNGKLKKAYGSPVTDPLGDGHAPPLYLSYSPDYIFVGNADTGALDNIGLGGYGRGKLTEVVNGFPVNKGSGWSALGPSGFAYNSNKKVDTLYVADGACNAVVAIVHASNLLKKDEITVESGCKSFKCPQKKFTCATLVLAGKPLNAPEAAAILPNGNLIVANTKGGNKLVELTPTGQVLATKVVDKSKKAGIFGLLAIGTDDSNTALYYTDTNTNTLQELEQ